ncbi:outer membrane protein assembly factor BamA [Mesorhizobium sp. NBSH29]|uniref:outer membrane protein assembly factor BamA n=1 Tax=Mesorhizobium sp. NBSH29 TaxID=2654249 RepID=UPI0018968C29|nr:outer membrane protein assembly factor BamA [Mesorhizobium sp. NBSH29]QPC87691.1 outer membrane protein assembly factor BamA [Mesorhizobium sp. NBSH29]
MKPASRFTSAVSAAALSAALVVPGAVAVQMATLSVAQAAVVRSIDVQGNKRVDSETVRSYLGITPGKNFSNADIDEAVKRLFATGMFSDVRINQSGSTLVVQVDELSIVNQVLFQGNKKIKDVQLAQAVQLKPRAAFSNAALEADADAVRQAYSRIGRDDATVTTQVMDLGEGRVNVVFEIAEGDRTKIARIDFSGNSAFSNRRLAEVISTKRSNVLSFLMRDDVYDENRIRADEEALRRFYFNRGYADFQVISANGVLDEATNEYVVSITVDEGARYTFGDITVESTIEGVDGESLRGQLQTNAGAVYSAKKVEDTLIGITEHVAGLGYAFAQVTPRGDRNFENNTISVAYTIDQGARTYVERIEIRGNARTRDYVVRREFDVSEGDAFNQVLIQRAKKRLERLGYFQSVEISTTPGSEPDQVVLVVDLVEQSTGEFSIGAGYTTGGESSGPSVEASITEKNFLGRGQYIKVSAGGGENSRDFTVSFTEPYFLGRRVAAGFDVFRQTRRYTNYESETTGGTVRIGLPITETLSTQFAYNLSQEKYNLRDRCDENGDGFPDAGCSISSAIVNGVQNSPWVKSSVSGTLLFNNIDNMKDPHSGLYATFTTEFAGLGGDAEFLKLTGRATYYHTISEEMNIVGLLSGGAGHIAPTGDGELRIFDHFKSNDRIIRGFEFNGIGPYDSATKDHLGGTTYFHASAEAQFPLPLIPESFGVKGAIFADAATLYGSDLNFAELSGTAMEWRASAGAGLIWASPFGPLRVDYAIPLKKVEGDEEQNFNFGISTKF